MSINLKPDLIVAFPDTDKHIVMVNDKCYFIVDAAGGVISASCPIEGLPLLNRMQNIIRFDFAERAKFYGADEKDAPKHMHIRDLGYWTQTDGGIPEYFPADPDYRKAAINPTDESFKLRPCFIPVRASYPVVVGKPQEYDPAIHKATGACTIPAVGMQSFGRMFTATEEEAKRIPLSHGMANPAFAEEFWKGSRSMPVLSPELADAAEVMDALTAEDNGSSLTLNDLEGVKALIAALDGIRGDHFVNIIISNARKFIANAVADWTMMKSNPAFFASLQEKNFIRNYLKSQVKMHRLYKGPKDALALIADDEERDEHYASGIPFGFRGVVIPEGDI